MPQYIRKMSRAMHEQRDEAGLAQTRRRPRCPTCSDILIEAETAISDPQTGNLIRLYRCDCGERIWDEVAALS
jgi:RNase P subunit RPR2